MAKVTELVAKLAAPAVEAAGCQLWDVEYVREAGTWFLRLYIDKEGGVDILDCEKVSRALSDLLDEADPIEGSYTLEVSSAGAERPLKRPGDFQRFMGSPVAVKLYKAQGGRKEFAGVLTGYDNGDVTITVGDASMTFAKADVAAKRVLREFRLGEITLAVGDIIKADTFAPGDKVDVCGTSKGKGYAGTIKRWHNHRLKETHGSGPVHRHAGSNGACSSPSRVFKGKRLPGHMGSERVTVQNLDIVKVDAENNLIAIRGAVPGPKNGIVYITDSVKA